jgi:type IV pilus assembly protein PilP
MMTKKNNLVLIGVLILPLVACSGDNSDLTKYIHDMKNRPAKAIDPIPKFVPLAGFKFPEKDDRRSPFKPIDQKKRTELAAPDQKRIKEPLEVFPLDALNFVGTLKQGNDIWALIKTPEMNVIPIKVGNYLGQNYGRVLVIKNDEIKLEETIKNSGQWEKHVTTLNLDTSK